MFPILSAKRLIIVLKVDVKGYLKKQSLLHFAPNNPGFDSLIISPPVGECRGHFTFIETRLGREKGLTLESFAAYKAKYDSVSKSAAALNVVMEREMGVSFDWHFVYASYSDTNIESSRLFKNIILMGSEQLMKFYGPSLSCLGML